MKTYYVAPSVLAATVAALDTNDAFPFAALSDAAPVWIEGLDHVELCCRGWGLRVVDRGCWSAGGRLRDGSALYAVRPSERRGPTPLRYQHGRGIVPRYPAKA